MLMKKHHPTFVFEIELFDGKPVLYLPDGTAFVSVIIVDTATGARSTASHYPVMKGFNHGAEIDPDCRAINDCIQRAKVKALAEVTGIGLKLWLRLEEDEINGDAPAVSARETRSAPPARRSAPPARAQRQTPYVDEELDELLDAEDDGEYAEGDDEVFETEARQPLARTSRPARQPATATSRRPAASQQTRRPAASRGANPFG
jgi:Protein of unknown function (DUF1071).